MHYPQVRSILKENPRYAEKFAQELSDQLESWSPRTAFETENLGWNNGEDWKDIRQSLQNVVEHADQRSRDTDKAMIQGLDEVYEYVTKPVNGYRIEFDKLMSQSMDETAERYESDKSLLFSD